MEALPIDADTLDHEAAAVIRNLWLSRLAHQFLDG
jgi:hypothetical protein